MSKTVKVRVLRKSFDKVVNKEIMKRKDFLVHDEGEVAREGDLVRIEQCRKISKRKAFSIAEIRKNKGQQFLSHNEDARARVIKEENEKTREFLARRKNTTEEIRNNTSLITDLMLIEKSTKGNLSKEQKVKVSQLKDKYGIKDWPPQKDALRLQIQSLREEIDDLTNSVANQEVFVRKLQNLLEDKEKGDEILTKMGKNVETLKKHTRKNILRKYLLENEQEESKKLSSFLDQDLSKQVEDLKI
ncbi:37S ribosomal protein S17, mitochondrial [Wickerhamomyces ciferrii]|uniref:37S ribosomal protein S17, mitochondrial n=1 Tax=Wickerhamomyces ciferrii (strain ATCC 14091 / BCRC 22168 / CBS 111 / JCM 3599 / NBRC 0793 / NRRL Y-1031 F-60-10) TaxID=1206466 RepID=K0KZ76_WICCF|nr:37S ribosomal protein S17, mitochondrial [Wickerhamomyces ciferrii]CCH46669.1 37S ribosomal protein S17, mitochondrial [Wickerhamomyces ciferrii]